MRILIVDDEKSIRNTLKEILEYENHEVVLAENGEQALSVLEQGKVQIDTVFCDIKMPGIDGIEVLEKIQEMDLDAPVIMAILIRRWSASRKGLTISLKNLWI